MMRIRLTISVLLFSVGLSFGALTRPGIFGPSDKATDQPTCLRVILNNAKSNYNYEVHLSTSSNFATYNELKLSNSSSSLRWFLTSKLDANTTYYWKARAKTATDSSSWTSTYSFTTGGDLRWYSPSDTGRNYSGNLAYFSWYRAAAYDSFKFQIDTSANFNTAEFKEFYIKDTFESTFWVEQTVANLLHGERYYHRFKGYKNGDSSSWSSVLWGNVIDTFGNARATYSDASWSPSFQWSGASMGYQFQLDTTLSFNSTLLYDTTKLDGGSTFPQESFRHLLFNQTYYWRVRPVSPRSTGSWLSFSYETGGMGNSIIQASSPYSPTETFRVPSAREVIGHQFQIDTTMNFDSPDLITMDSVNTSFVVNELDYGQTYFVRSRFYHPNDTSGWSRVRSYSIVSEVSTYYPFNTWTDIVPGDSFRWNDGYDGTTHYRFQLSQMADFKSVEVDTVVSHDDFIKTRYLQAGNLKFNTTYHWRVLMWHQSDTSNWSFPTRFTTIVKPELSRPFNSTLLTTGATTDFIWDPIKNVKQYQLLVDSSMMFNSPLLRDTIVTGNQVQLSELLFRPEYYWKVRAITNGDTSEWSDTWKFTVTNPVRLDGPRNGLENYSFFSLDWRSIKGTNGYLIHYDTSADFTNPVVIQDTGTNDFFHFFTEKPDYLYSTKYFWRVKVFHATDTTDWSDVWSFTTRDRVSPTLISPADGSRDVSLGVTLKWEKYSGANTYLVQYAENPEFKDFAQLATSNPERSVALKPNTKYYWRVISRNSAGNPFGEWSEAWSFKTQENMDVPVLVSPANKSTSVNPISVSLTWQSIQGANYDIQWADNPSFTTPFARTSSAPTYNLANLKSFTTYYWKVRARNAFVTGEWSDTWKFTTDQNSSINEITKPIHVIYPNPTSGTITIQDFVGELSIHDISGMLVQTVRLEVESEAINVSSLSEGVYTVRLDSENTTTWQKLIVE